MARRRYQLGSEPAFRPPLWTGLLLGGLVAGVLVGAIALRPAADGRDDEYLIMASSLFAHGESPSVMRERLIGVGFSQPMVAVSQLAGSIADGSDRRKLRYADALAQFGKALGSIDIPLSTPRPPATGASTSPVASGTAGPEREATRAVGPPTAAGTRAPVLGSATPTDARTPGVATTATRTATPTLDAVVGRATLTPIAAVASAKGKVKPAEGGSVRLRKGPSAATESLQIIAYGASVEILDTVQGQAVEPSESRWYQVRYGTVTGYIYSRLVAVGE